MSGFNWRGAFSIFSFELAIARPSPSVGLPPSSRIIAAPTSAACAAMCW